MAVGMLGYLAVGVESSAASTSAYSASTVDFVAFQSETLDTNREDLFSPNIRAQWDEEARYNGVQRPGGNVTGIIHHSTVGYFLRSFFDVTTAQNGYLPATSHAAVRNHLFVTKNTQFHCGSGSDLPTLTLEVYRGPCMPNAANIGSAFVFYNMAGNALELSVDAGGMARYSADMVGREYGVKGNQLPVFAPPHAFLWAQTSVSIDGTASNIFQNLTVRLENNLQGILKLGSGFRPDTLKRQDFRRISVNGSLTYESLTEYNRFTAGSESRLLVTFVAPERVSTAGGADAAGVPAEMQWDVPRFVYQTQPFGIPGPGLIPVNFTGRGMLDPTSKYSLQVVVVTSRTNGYQINAAA